MVDDLLVFLLVLVGFPLVWILVHELESAYKQYRNKKGSK